jgi:hypothetical protein
LQSEGFRDSLTRHEHSPPRLGCVENLTRKYVCGPGFWGTDTSLIKNLRISERFHLQIRAEAFNIFNHTL